MFKEVLNGLSKFNGLHCNALSLSLPLSMDTLESERERTSACLLASKRRLLGIPEHLSKNLEGLHMCYMRRYITYLLPFQVLQNLNALSGTRFESSIGEDM